MQVDELLEQLQKIKDLGCGDYSIQGSNIHEYFTRVFYFSDDDWEENVDIDHSNKVVTFDGFFKDFE